MEKSKIELLLEKLQLRHNQFDIKKLNENIEFLKKWKLSRISDRLLWSTKPSKFLETLTELNFTTQLIKSLSSRNIINIEYEPENSKRPIDLEVTLNNITYFIQIKSLSNSIKDTRASKIVTEIRREFQNIPSFQGVNIEVCENFLKNNVKELIAFIKDNINKCDGKKLRYLGDNGVIAHVEIQALEKNFRKHLTLCSFRDLEVVNITGMTRDQIKKSLEKAANAFASDSSDKNINLIVSEIRNDRLQAIDFAEAIYGSEYSTFNNGKMLTHRSNDGLFLDENFAKKVAGIIVLHKKEPSLSSHYV